jgi:AraC-like DNA-binding protein
MNVTTRLFGSSLVGLDHFHHPADSAHFDPDGERASGFSIAWVERGQFDVTVELNRRRVDSRSVFVTRPDLIFRCHHDEEIPTDVCLSMEYDSGFVEDICRSENLKSEQVNTVVPLTNRMAWLRLRLKRAASNSDEAIAIETLAGDLLAETFSGNRKTHAKLYSPGQLAWYAERIEAVRELIETNYSSVHSLETLANHVGMSPYHFARVFRELTGVPPHRYLRRMRLAAAARRLLDGASVTETCFASGFNHIGYFSRAFQSAFGVPPSEYRS